jgi:hypothetical protein
MPDSVNTQGGSYFEGEINVTGGTFIGRDQVIVLSGYTAEQLDDVLARLLAHRAAGQVQLQLDPAQTRITSQAPGLPPITLSKGAAESLLGAAARRADDRAYLTALSVHPRYGRWATQFVPLSGDLAEEPRAPGHDDVHPEFDLLLALGEGAQRQIKRTRLADVRTALDEHPALIILGEPGAGKSTLLFKLALETSEACLAGRAARTPLWVTLAHYRGDPNPLAFLEAQWRERSGQSDFLERLRAGRWLLLSVVHEKA